MKHLNSYNETLTHSELLLLERNISPGKAVMKYKDKPKDEKKKVNNLISQLGYEYSFVFVFAPAIKGLYPIITHLVHNMEMPQEVTKESIVYLTIATIGILLQEPKEKYKDIIQKVKDEGLYHLIKPLVTSLKGIKNIFSFIAKRVGKLISTYYEMFAYTALFVPFAMAFKDIIDQQNISLLTILEAFANDGVGKVLSTAVGIGTFGAKHFLEDIISSLKSFKDRGIIAIKNIVNKIKSIDWSMGIGKDKEALAYAVQNIETNENNIIRFKDYFL